MTYLILQGIAQISQFSNFRQKVHALVDQREQRTVMAIQEEIHIINFVIQHIQKPQKASLNAAKLHIARKDNQHFLFHSDHLNTI